MDQRTFQFATKWVMHTSEISLTALSTKDIFNFTL